MWYFVIHKKHFGEFVPKNEFYEIILSSGEDEDGEGIKYFSIIKPMSLYCIYVLNMQKFRFEKININKFVDQYNITMWFDFSPHAKVESGPISNFSKVLGNIKCGI